jgi:hypothetical protein
MNKELDGDLNLLFRRKKKIIKREISNNNLYLGINKKNIHKMNERERN